MSRRYTNSSSSSRPKQQQEWTSRDNNNNHHNNSFHKSSFHNKKFIPKTQNPNPNSNPTLSDSIRQQSAPSIQSNAATEAPAHGSGGGNFVNYLPQDEAVAAGLGSDEGGLDPVESQRVVDLLNRELSKLLKLGPREFWRQVASDTSLHELLDSFLKYRSRWYDFPHRGAKKIVAGVIVGELELSRRVFMLLYRISSNRDPGAQAADALSSKDHAALLQEKGLLNLPKLLDMCAIYGHENEELTHLLVSNALKAQPWMHDELTAVVSNFLGIAHTMHQRCLSSLEALFSSGHTEAHVPNQHLMDFLEVLDFINDAVVSMDAFVNAYRPAALFFSYPVEMSSGNEELVITLTRLHDALLPSLRRGFRVILPREDEAMISNTVVSLKMLSTRIVKFGWKLLDFCYLSSKLLEEAVPIPSLTKMFPAKVEDPIIRADILIQTFREISGISLYSLENQVADTFLQKLEKDYQIMGRLQDLQNAGWIIMDDEQLQYLTGVMMSSPKITLKEKQAGPVVLNPTSSNKAEVDEDAAIMESKISQIKDLFPDYGKGFLTACLEVYNQNPEEVIQRILEGTLHEDLKRLDVSSETMPTSKPAPALGRKDKGKGKLIESTDTSPITSSHPPKPVVTLDQQDVSPAVSSPSMLGRFVRKSVSLPDHYSRGPKEDGDAARTTAMISQYEYEDEYDDSFDDLGFNVAESGLEDSEMMNNRTETENSPLPASASKWGSRKKPQFYVKDGKNYSYKVAGSVAAANDVEASLINHVQGELIHGLGRGGNKPIGAVKKLIEYQEQSNQSDQPDLERSDMGGRESGRNSRGRGRRGGRPPMQAHNEQENSAEPEEGQHSGNFRGRGRRGRGNNHHHKDRAMRKHFSGISGF